MKYPLEDSQLWKELRRRCKDESDPGQQFRSSMYLSRIAEVESACENVLPLVAEIHPHFLPHGAQHSRAIIFRLGQLIPQKTIRRLTAAELYVLMVSALCHDLGMIAAHQDIETAERSPSFQEFRREEATKFDRVRLLREQGKEYAAGLAYRYLLAEWFRPRHATRSGEFVLSHAKELGDPGCGDNRLLGAILTVCSAHWLDNPRDLEDPERFRPRFQTTHGEELNIRFLALCLRIGDLLDMDSPRACPLLRSLLGDLPESSKAHWDRHDQFSVFSVHSDEVEIRKKCHSQEEHRLLYEWCEWLHAEVERAAALLAGEERCKLNITPDRVVWEIRDDGSYVFTKYRFEVDDVGVFKKLFGEHLYGVKHIFIRELLQNALDATRCRIIEDLRAENKEWDATAPPWKVPRAVRDNYAITFRLELRELNGEDRLVISCHDCGIGMSRYVIENHFLKVGRSYYDSFRFRSRYGFRTIAQFGIGFMSCVLVADHVEVETCHDLPADSQGATEEHPVRLQIPGWRNYFIVTPAKERLARSRRPRNFQPESYAGHGTSVHCFLAPDAVRDLPDLAEYLRSLAVSVEVPICVEYAAGAWEKFCAEKGWPSIKHPRGPIIIRSSWPPEDSGRLVEAPHDLAAPSRIAFGARTYSASHPLSQNGLAVSPMDPASRGGHVSEASGVSELVPSWVSQGPWRILVDLWGDDCLNLTTSRTTFVRDERVEQLRGKIRRSLPSVLRELVARLAAQKRAGQQTSAGSRVQDSAVSSTIWWHLDPWEPPLDDAVFLNDLVQVTCVVVYHYETVYMGGTEIRARDVVLADMGPGSCWLYDKRSEVGNTIAVVLGQDFVPLWALDRFFKISLIELPSAWARGVRVMFDAPNKANPLEFGQGLRDQPVLDDFGAWSVLNPRHELAQRIVEALEKADLPWRTHPWATSFRRCDNLAVDRVDHNGAVCLSVGRPTGSYRLHRIVEHLAAQGHLDERIPGAMGDLLACRQSGEGK